LFRGRKKKQKTNIPTFCFFDLFIFPIKKKVYTAMMRWAVLLCALLVGVSAVMPDSYQPSVEYIQINLTYFDGTTPQQTFKLNRYVYETTNYTQEWIGAVRNLPKSYPILVTVGAYDSTDTLLYGGTTVADTTIESISAVQMFSPQTAFAANLMLVQSTGFLTRNTPLHISDAIQVDVLPMGAVLQSTYCDIKNGNGATPFVEGISIEQAFPWLVGLGDQVTVDCSILGINITNDYSNAYLFWPTAYQNQNDPAPADYCTSVITFNQVSSIVCVGHNIGKNYDYILMGDYQIQVNSAAQVYDNYYYDFLNAQSYSYFFFEVAISDSTDFALYAIDPPAISGTKPTYLIFDTLLDTGLTYNYNLTFDLQSVGVNLMHQTNDAFYFNIDVVWASNCEGLFDYWCGYWDGTTVYGRVDPYFVNDVLNSFTIPGQSLKCEWYLNLFSTFTNLPVPTEGPSSVQTPFISILIEKPLNTTAAAPHVAGFVQYPFQNKAVSCKPTEFMMGGWVQFSTDSLRLVTTPNHCLVHRQNSTLNTNYATNLTWTPNQVVEPVCQNIPVTCPNANCNKPNITVTCDACIGPVPFDILGPCLDVNAVDTCNPLYGLFFSLSDKAMLNRTYLLAHYAGVPFRVTFSVTAVYVNSTSTQHLVFGSDTTTENFFGACSGVSRRSPPVQKAPVRKRTVSPESLYDFSLSLIFSVDGIFVGLNSSEIAAVVAAGTNVTALDIILNGTFTGGNATILAEFLAALVPTPSGPTTMPSMCYLYDLVLQDCCAYEEQQAETTQSPWFVWGIVGAALTGVCVFIIVVAIIYSNSGGEKTLMPQEFELFTRNS
jgi:hypothetical protein